MVEVVFLRSKDTAVEIEAHRGYGGYCSLLLHQNGSTQDIGGDLFNEFARKLVRFLESPHEIPATQHQDGFWWRHFCTTDGPSHFFFGRETEEGYIIKIWNGEDVKMAGVFAIDRNETDIWISRLNDWLRAKPVDRIEASEHSVSDKLAIIGPTARGMRGRDHYVFGQVANEKNLIIIVRNSNASRKKYISKRGYKPFPIKLNVGERVTDPNKGLIAADPNDPTLKSFLTQVAPSRTYEQFIKELIYQGFKVGTEKEGYIILDRIGNAFYSSYELHGVYHKETGINAWSAENGANLSRELNVKFGKDLIQYGPHDLWPNRNNKSESGPGYGPQPPCAAYMPDGKVFHLTTVADIKAFYKEHSIKWSEIYPDH